MRPYLRVSTFVITICMMPLIAAHSEDMPSEENAAVGAYQLRMSGKVYDAKAMLEKAVAKNPSDSLAQFELARTHMHTLLVHKDGEDPRKSTPARLKKAANVIKAVVKLEPDNARYQYWAGIITMYDGIAKAHSIWSMPVLPLRMNSSTKYFEKAVKLNSDYHEARLTLLGLYDRLPVYMGGSKKRARKHTEVLEKSDPVYGARARCELKPKPKPNEQIKIWLKVVEKDEKNPGAHEGLGRAYMKVEKWDKAEEHFSQAVELDSSRCIAFLDFSRELFSEDKFEEADEAVQQLLNQGSSVSGPIRAKGLRRLAMIRTEQGRNEEASALTKEANKLDPCEDVPGGLPFEELYGPLNTGE